MKTVSIDLSAEEARHLALFAHGLTHPDAAKPMQEHDPFAHTIAQLGLIQIDSVNAFARSHYLPVFSRNGSFPPKHFDEALFSAPGPDSAVKYFEYRTHELSLMPIEDFPLWQWRMQKYRERFAEADSWARQNHIILQRVRTQLAERGPSTAAELVADVNAQRDIPYWSTMRTEEKHALEVMFHTGEVISAGRQGFQRRYGLAEQVLPEAVRQKSTPTKSEAIRELTLRSVHHLGVGTLHDIKDYFRLRYLSEVREALTQLEDEGLVIGGRVSEWGSERVWVSAKLLKHPDIDHIMVGNLSSHDALLSPFDPLVWFRPRAERIFNFDYRIEIYVPEAKRQFGYYCLPILLDDRIVGRFDLAANRKESTLEVRASWAEPTIRAGDETRIAALLSEAATWQGLGTITISDRGNYAKTLKTALK